MSSLRALGVALLLTFSLIPPVGAQEQSESEWIVTLDSKQDIREAALSLTSAAGLRLGFVFDEVLGGFSFEGSDRAAEALERNPLVSSVTRSQIFTLEDSAGWGIFRIGANDLHALDGGAYRGAGARIAVIDSGIDLDHPDLAPNLDTANGKNCVGGVSADDDNGHGTHVAGIAAAAYGPNGFGIAGVAPEATLVPVKSFTSGGSATTAQVLCGINHVAALAADGIPTVANMSFGESGSDSQCDDAVTSDVLHEAVCDLADTGVIPVAAAGNSSINAATFLPAAFDEVITISALTDFDGSPGGSAGCEFGATFGYDCDDTFAVYSNYGLDVDAIAPGTKIYSTLPGGGHGVKSGTSMAAPHASGVVAAMLAANDTLTTDQARFLLQTSGECPEPAGSLNANGGATCVEQGQWPGDSDSSTEPLVNALRAVQAVVDLGSGPVDFPPTAGFTADCTETTCDFTDTSSDFEGPIVSWNWDFGDGTTSTEQSPTHVFLTESTYNVELTVTDEGGNSDVVSQQVQVPPPFSPSVQGDWVGVYGADGHVLAAWEGSSDLVSFPFAAVTVEQGSRYRWSSSTNDVRALESPDETERRAATFYDANQIRVSLDFTSDYSGNLHLYALDWDTTDRRQVVTVDDGSGPQSVNIYSPFDDGAWMSFPINVTAGASVSIIVDRTGGANAVLSGILLGSETGNTPPTADAGPDQTVSDSDGAAGEGVTLDGSGSSDSDGTIVSYEWTEGGSQIATGANPTVTLGDGDHTITLTVTDNDGVTASDDVVITVEAPVVGSYIHVHDLDDLSQKLGKGAWKGVVDVRVSDSLEGTVLGFSVSGTFTQNGWSTNVNCTEGGAGDADSVLNGVCRLDSGQLPGNGGQAAFTVTDVTLSGYTYTISANHDPDGESDGTTIQLSK